MNCDYGASLIVNLSNTNNCNNNDDIISSDPIVFEEDKIKGSYK